MPLKKRKINNISCFNIKNQIDFDLIKKNKNNNNNNKNNKKKNNKVTPVLNVIKEEIIYNEIIYNKIIDNKIIDNKKDEKKLDDNITNIDAIDNYINIPNPKPKSPIECNDYILV